LGRRDSQILLGGFDMQSSMIMDQSQLLQLAGDDAKRHNSIPPLPVNVVTRARSLATSHAIRTLRRKESLNAWMTCDAR
jgi:hypothetical protein